MTLTDPRDDLAEQSSFVGYLMGLAGLAQLVHALAASDDGRRTDTPHSVDDFVHVLLGVASLGQAVDRLVESTAAPHHCDAAATPASMNTRWLR
jgi:hypothetical protein